MREKYETQNKKGKKQYEKKDSSDAQSVHVLLCGKWLRYKSFPQHKNQIKQVNPLLC